eukprot:Gb_13598 [translate_table: standard]
MPFTSLASVPHFSFLQNSDIATTEFPICFAAQFNRSQAIIPSYSFTACRSTLVPRQIWVQSSIPTNLTSFLIATILATNISLPSSFDTFADLPQTLSGADKGLRIQKPKSTKAESCTGKCVGTCIRGGAGSPGEGPLNIRRPLVVFKNGFRSRQYCLIECSDICNLIKDGDDGP